MSISIEEHLGHNNVPEGSLRALVTRTTEPGPLAELARGFGDAEGANLGVLEHGAEAVDVVLLNHVVCFRQTSARQTPGASIRLGG